MPGPFEPLLYWQAIRARWHRILAAAAIAAAVALVASLLLPARYDATVLLSIQPAMSGPYPAAMSPVYLEYLRSYESFIQGESLVAALLTELKLDQPPHNYSVESFRRSALSASLVKNSKFLRLTVRLRDPRTAHEAALRLAALAARANAEMNAAQAARARARTQNEQETARARVDSARAALQKFRRENRETEVARQAARDVERKLALEDQLENIEADLAEKQARLTSLESQMEQDREKIAAAGQGARGEPLSPAREQLREQVHSTRADLAGLRARQKTLRGLLEGVRASGSRSQAAQATLELRQREVEREYEMAQAAFAVSAGRANDPIAAGTVRGEEIDIADPGVVPSRPSSPSPGLNALVAAALGLLAGLLYETWAWNARQAEQTMTLLSGRR